MAALGLPLVLLLGALAELVAGVTRYGPKRRAVEGFSSLWASIRRARTRREGATPLELLGAGMVLFAAGLVGAAAVGAAPGSLVIVYLALVAAVAGACLAAAETPDRPAAVRIRARILDAALAEPAAAVALGAVFLRWRAVSLDRIWGVQEVVGSTYEVGPLLATVGTALAIVALVGVAALRVLPDPELPRGRSGRPGGGAALLRIGRWAVVGATASLVPSLVAGMDLTTASPDLDLLVWAGTAVVGAALVGSLWGLADRLAPWTRRAILLPAVAALAAAAATLVVLA